MTDESKRPALVRDVFFVFDDKGRRTDFKMYADASPWVWLLARRVGRVRVSRNIFAEFAPTWRGGLLILSIHCGVVLSDDEWKTLLRWLGEVGRVVMPPFGVRGVRPIPLPDLED